MAGTTDAWRESARYLACGIIHFDSLITIILGMLGVVHEPMSQGKALGLGSVGLPADEFKS